jgi:hypothetical protein
LEVEIYSQIQQLDMHGWVAVSRQSSPPFFSNILRRLQVKTTECSVLRNFEPTVARNNTLSSRYGRDAFPIHTDFAARAEPPRFILLFAGRPREAATTLYNTEEVVSYFGLKYLLSANFLVKSGTKNFYAPFLINRNGHWAFRFNGDTMKPLNENARNICEFVLDQKWKNFTRVDWQVQKVVLIDNWRIMHSREAISKTDEGAVLRRIAIWGDNVVGS